MSGERYLTVFRRRCSPTCCPEDGFTLLEVMVAVAIIAISFVALIGSQSQSIAVAETSRFEITASFLAQQKLAELEIGDFDEVQSAEGDYAEEFADFHWQIEVEEPGEDETGIPGSAELLKVVNLVVRRGTDENMVYRVRTVLVKPIKPVSR